MGTANDKTLRSYESKVREYIGSVPGEVLGDLKEWVDMALSLLPEGSCILEIGCGFGRDAEYIESKGFSVLRTDAAQAFVDHIRENGYDAQLFNILSDPMPKGFDIIFANAVFLHFTAQQLLRVLIKVRESLPENGILAFTVKYGQGSEWTNARIGAPRFYQYWTPASLAVKLEKAGFVVDHIFLDSRRIWVHVIASKV